MHSHACAHAHTRAHGTCVHTRVHTGISAPANRYWVFGEGERLLEAQEPLGGTPALFHLKLVPGLERYGDQTPHTLRAGVPSAMRLLEGLLGLCRGRFEVLTPFDPAIPS